jgi:hypothetical protein
MRDRRKVDPVSDAEKAEAFDLKRELIGFAADNTERQLFLKLAFRTGDISTVWIDPIQAGYLFWHLKRLLQDRPKSHGSPLKFVNGVGPVSYGWAP